MVHEPERKPSQWFGKIAFVLAVLGLLCASPLGHILYVMAMISVIGIPVALLVAAIPTIALVTVTAYLFWRFIPFVRRWGVLGAFAIACALLVIIPPLHNQQITAQVAELTGGDAGALPRPGDRVLGAEKALALVSMEGRPALCSEICLHLLMSSQAAAVLMVPLPTNEAIPQPTMRAYRYALERQATCPKPKSAATGARPHRRHFLEKTPGTIAGDYARMLEQGYCLTATETTLAEANLAFMVIDSGDFPVPSILSPIAARTVASRAGIYAPASDGQLRVLWQRTPVSYSLLGPVLWTKITVASGMGATATRWWREETRTTQPALHRLSELLRRTGFTLPAEIR